MKKCLLFAALLMVLQDNYLRAQNLFDAPDTVCPRQLVQLKSNYPTASSHFWGFCSGYLLDAPVGDNLKDITFWEAPSAIEVAEDKGKYYAFAIYKTSRKFVKLEFGDSFNNPPRITDYSNMDDVLPVEPNTLYMLKTEDSNYHIFVAGGNSSATSTLSRIDFGKELGSTPNIVNFGNLGGVMRNPTGLFVAKENNNKWYGYVLNNIVPAPAEMIRIEFDSNISFTPTATNLGVVLDGSGAPALTEPNDLAAIKNNGLWHFFVTNKAGNFVFRLDMGNSLAVGSPVAVPIGNLLGKLNQPSGISIIRDCDSLYALITNRGNHSLVRMDMPSVFGPYTGTSFGNRGSMRAPSALSSIIRDRDELFCFATNIDSSISRIRFAQCTNSSIQYSTTNVPPAYSYDTAGTYNIFYVINEGRPDMQAQCKLITVLPTPPMFITPLDTTICQGDTIQISAFSVNALSYQWSPDYHLSATNLGKVSAWPDYNQTYKLHMPFPHNCIIDTVVNVTVKKVKADAGPNRVIGDGASTILGGPLTSFDADNPGFYFYRWTPDQFIDDVHSLNPVVNPPYDITYTLHVYDRSPNPVCFDIDTVVVHVSCKDLNLPNAFVPSGGNTRATFGLANQQIVKLSYFKIYDRWGKLVFTAGEDIADPQKEWDGTVNGEHAPMGVYTWIADGFCASGDRFTKSGNVTLIR